MKNKITTKNLLRQKKQTIYLIFKKCQIKFQGSARYWESRYMNGGNSGFGSYNHFANFKAQVINNFVEKNKINEVIELGFGDGNQLKLANYPRYLGFEVSPTALVLCRKMFTHDSSKKFELLRDYKGETAQLSLSLDVIYHLIEDDIFRDHMRKLFDSSTRYIIIYSTNETNEADSAPHTKHRKFTRWVEDNYTDWELIKEVPNKYSESLEGRDSSSANFYIYKKGTQNFRIL